MEQNKVLCCGTKLKSLPWNKNYEFAMEQMLKVWYGAMHCSTKFLIILVTKKKKLIREYAGVTFFNRKK